MNGLKTRQEGLITENRKLLKKLREVSSHDPLTKLYAYQHFIERLNEELKNAKKFMLPMSIILLDIDYFKSINDTYGHRMGNSLLKQFAQFLRQLTRPADILTRYVSAGFSVILPNTTKRHALLLAKRLCEKIQRHHFKIKRIKIKLKVSIGVINYPDDGLNTEIGILDAVDKAVRKAKERGGDNVCIYEAVSEKDRVQVSRKEEVEDLKMSLRKAGKKLDQVLLESIYAFARALELRDHYTGEHAAKMIGIVRSLGKELGLSQKMIENLEHAAVLHDLGKIGIDDNILRKKAKLTKKEYDEIKKHPLIGAEIIRSIHFLKDIVPYILYHHERFDGKGYAAGLKGNEIPLGARVLAIADVYQALISDRPYRKAYPKAKALDIIKSGSGSQFDPDIVKALLRTTKKEKR